MTETLEKIERIEHDFDEKRGPFADVEFPEERLLRVLPHNSKEERLRLISAFCTFDYNRNASQLVDNLVVLHERDKYKFEPSSVPLPQYEGELAELFERIGFRYPNKDAHAWCKNNEIICKKYNSQWHELLLETGCDAPSLVEQVEKDDFNVLKGVKVGPMYARIINDDVCELSGLWELDIPLDTHIRKLSKKLFGDDTTDDEIRKIWRLYAERHSIDRHIVDGGLWFIGNQWDNWGEDYWEDL